MAPELKEEATSVGPAYEMGPEATDLSENVHVDGGTTVVLSQGEQKLGRGASQCRTREDLTFLRLTGFARQLRGAPLGIDLCGSSTKVGWFKTLLKRLDVDSDKYLQLLTAC